MAVLYTDVEDWFGFSVDANEIDNPSQAQVTAAIASLTSDFKGFTGITLDDTDSKHLLFFKMLMDKWLYNWHKQQSASAETFSSPAGSTGRSNSYVFYNKEAFDRLMKEIRDSIDKNNTIEFYDPDE